MRTAWRSNGRLSTAASLFTSVAGLAAAVLIATAMLAVGPQRVEAKPEFSAKTGRPCGYCHTNPAGGGKLKRAGERFKANGFKLKK